MPGPVRSISANPHSLAVAIRFMALCRSKSKPIIFHRLAPLRGNRVEVRMSMSPSRPGCRSPAAGLRQGAQVVMPLVLPVSIFGLAVGAVAAQKGLSLVELSLMNGLVYAGAAQLVALGLWPEQWNASP